MRNKIVMITALLAVMVGMTGIAEASGAVTPSSIAFDVNTNAPVAITAKFWNTPDGSGAGTYQPDRLKVSIHEDTNNNGFYDEGVDSQVNDMEIELDGAAYTAGVKEANPINWDLSEISVIIDSVANNRFTETFNVRDNGATVGDIYFIVSSAGIGDTYAAKLTATTRAEAIPEFATVAIPIAAVLGLVFIFQQKKNKKE